MSAPAIKRTPGVSRRRPLVRVTRVQAAVQEMTEHADRPDLEREEKLHSLGIAALHACQAKRAATPGTQADLDADVLLVEIADRASFLGFGWRK